MMIRRIFDIRLVLLICFAIAGSASPVTARAAAQDGQKPATTKTEDCGCDVQKLPDVLATINGVQIKKAAVYGPLEERIRQLQQTIVEARNRELTNQINALLLQQESARRGVTEYQMINSEVASKVPEPTEADARLYFEANKAQMGGSPFQEMKGVLIGYIRSQRLTDATAKFAQALRATSKVQVLVDKPTAPEKEADRERVFATVDGIPITSGRIEDALKPIVFQ